MGLLAFVARVARCGDCTNGGISSNHDQLCLVNVDGPFEPSDDCPAVMLDSHVLGCLRIVPAVKTEAGNWIIEPGGWYMDGGNYASTSDSRFSAACNRLLGHRFYGAVAIHDRRE